MSSMLDKERKRWALGAHIMAWATVVTMIGLVASACGDDQQSPQAGKVLYAESCQSCHGNAKSGEGSVGGAPNHGPTGHTWHHADGQIVDIVLGRFEYPGRVMPSFDGELTEQQVMQVLAFLKTSWTSEQLSSQAEVSRNWEKLYGGQ